MPTVRRRGRTGGRGGRDAVWNAVCSQAQPDPGRTIGGKVMPSTDVRRRLPVGAEVLPEGGAHFRVWAPRRRRVAIVLERGGEFYLEAEANGYFAGRVEA